jgi:xylan 1,4-beta-xylosidase
LWNYHDVAGSYDERRTVRLTIDGLSRDRDVRRAVEYSIDEHSGNAYTAWLAMGSPQSPSAEQVAMLHEAEKMRPVRRRARWTSRGGVQLDVAMPRQSVKLIEIALPVRR